MCGRFTLRLTPQELAEFFDLFRDLDVLDQLTPRYNIAPTQNVLVIRQDQTQRVPSWMHWGLIPSWSKDAKSAARCINARSETVAEKPSFRAAYKQRRCLIPADGYYEWVPPHAKKRHPIYVQSRDGQPFAFASLWERWRSPVGAEILSTTLLTTTPNSQLEPVHDRMPVILPPETYDQWLNPKATAEQLQDLLVPAPSEWWQFHDVSTRVNKAADEGPECIQPVR